MADEECLIGVGVKPSEGLCADPGTEDFFHLAAVPVAVNITAIAVNITAAACGGQWGGVERFVVSTAWLPW
ncbi:MAG: hypothetical protein AABZ02_01280, partial [Bacteroidota bacterium]